jgi:hypothetical protein
MYKKKSLVSTMEKFILASFSFSRNRKLSYREEGWEGRGRVLGIKKNLFFVLIIKSFKLSVP